MSALAPSGREYAIVNGGEHTAFVEVTDPRNPVFFGTVPLGGSALIADVKVYRDHAYVCHDGGALATGIQVISLEDIDDHVVTLVGLVPDSPVHQHNLAVDETSGFLYALDSSDPGSGLTRAWDLSNPASPVLASADLTPGSTVHDTQAVTYADGRQILLASSASAWEQRLEIWDVTARDPKRRL